MNIFNTNVSEIDDSIRVTYCQGEYSGHCMYKKVTLHGKKIRQNVLVLAETQMDDIIEYFYKTGKIGGSQDLSPLSYEIQRHSRELAEGYQSSPRYQ